MEDNSGTVPVLDLVVQTAVIRMNAPVRGPDGKPVYPRMALWVDAASAMVLSADLFEPDEAKLDILRQSLGELIGRIHGAPRQIQLRDPRLARDFREIASGSGLDIVVRESLPQLDEAIEHLSGFGALNRGKREKGLLDVPGMILDRLIGFAEAAERFYNAAPWQHLVDDDLIEIHSPAGPKGTRFTQVLGAGGKTVGLGFVGKRSDHESIREGNGLPRGQVYSVFFDEIDAIPFPDGEAWDQYNLPLANSDAYAIFGSFSKSKGFTYSSADELAWVEGLLRALASTTEDELDRAEWEKTVATAIGPMTFKLSLPILLEQISGAAKRDPVQMHTSMRMTLESMMRGLAQDIAAGKRPETGSIDPSSVSDFTPTTGAERAQELCYDAHEARGRRQLQLARQALTIDPDCCDAMMLLADRTSDVQKVMSLCQRAVEAGERRLGKEFFDENAGHFWGLIETRPYMRARQRLALSLMDQNCFDEAIAHFSEMLRLNPGDNQGVRYPLAQSLLRANKLDELDAMLNEGEYKDDLGAEWEFTRLLLQFRRLGDSPQTRRQLQSAEQSNEFVVPMLTGRIPVPPSPGAYSYGDVSEAAMCVNQFSDVWEQTPGAIDWLETRARGSRKSAPKSGKGRRKGGERP